MTSQFSSRTRAVLGMLRALLMLGLLAACGRGARAQFPNDGRFYQVRQGTNAAGQNVSQLFVLERWTTTYSATPESAQTSGTIVLNALARNPRDRFIYALELGSNRLYRLGPSVGGTLSTPQLLGAVNGLPTATYNSGTFDRDGNYYVGVIAANALYRVSNINAATSSGATLTTTTITLSPAVNIGDIAVSPVNNQIYGVSATAASSQLHVINPATGATSTRALTGIPNANATVGSVFFDLTGRLYAYSNNGFFYVVDTNTAVATQISTAPTTAQSDGASDPFFSVPLTATKAVVSIVRSEPATYDITFRVTLTNDSAGETAANVQLTDNLDLTFASGAPTLSIIAAPANAGGVALSPNTAYTGRAAGDTRLLIGNQPLGPGASTSVSFTVRAAYPSAAAVPASTTNTVYGSSTSTTNSSGYNSGFTFPSGVPVPPPDLIGQDDSPPTPVSLLAITGRAFEDVNFGGGAGRAFGTAGTAGVPAGARVELYSVAGTTATFARATTTDATGQYQFTNLAAGPYLVRVVNGGANGVKSTRPANGATTAIVPVQTFRVNNGAADTGQVGGNSPSTSDGAEGAAGTTINTATGALSLGGFAQTTGAVTVGAASVGGVDFGFNFDTIVNPNSAGQGSLRQFLVNSNALANTGLAQVGQTAGVENTIFQIPEGLLTGGVARIGVTGVALPAITDAFTSINGATQTASIGDTNPATLGASTSVGVGAANVPALPGPEVEISDAGGLASGLDIRAADTTVRRIAIYGFGNAVNAVGQGNIVVSNVARVRIEQNAIGSTATSFSDPAGAPGGRSGGDNIHVLSGDNGLILNNLIGYSAGLGIALDGAGGDGAQTWTIQQNQVLGNGIGNPAQGGLAIERSGSANVQSNLFSNNQGPGVDTTDGLGANAIANNTISNNGLGGANPAGIRLFGNGSTISNNVIATNGGAGVLVVPSAQGNSITTNSIFNNGGNSGTGTNQLGIDLLEAGQNTQTGAPVGGRGFVTPNDLGDTDTAANGANGLLNFPVIESATLSTVNNRITIAGFARPGSTIEFFVAAPDPSGFGEGQTFIISRVEGSADDDDATVAAYNNPVPNVGTDNTNRFLFVIPRGALNVGSVLTSTATLSSNTSEFSNNVAVTTSTPVLNGRVYLDANTNEVRDNAEVSTNLDGLFVKAFALDAGGAPAATATAFAPVDAATGLFSFNALPPGRYRLVLDDNATLSDATPVNVAALGYVGTEAPGGIRDGVVIAAGAQATPQQNFGLFAGSSISGLVFNDNGLGANGLAADGVRQTGEVGLPNVTVRALGGGGQVLATAQTNAQGAYTLFVPTGSGAIRVVEANPSGFISTGADVGNSGGAYDRAADAIAFTPVAGTTYAGLNFGDVRTPILLDSSSLTINPGGSVVLPHQFTAYEPGTVTFATGAVATPAGITFTRVVYRDLNCDGQLDAAEGSTPLTSLAVTKAQIDAGGGEAQICVLIKEFAPANAPQGARDAVTLTATFDYAENGVAPIANAVLTRPDTVVVKQTGDLVLTKAANLATARPGDSVVYRITYRNQGAEPLQALVIQDVVPAFTTFVSQSAGPLPTGLTAPTFTQGGANNSALTWTFGGALAPNATGYVEFTIRLNP